MLEQERLECVLLEQVPADLLSSSMAIVAIMQACGFFRFLFCPPKLIFPLTPLKKVILCGFYLLGMHVQSHPNTRGRETELFRRGSIRGNVGDIVVVDGKVQTNLVVLAT